MSRERHTVQIRDAGRSGVGMGLRGWCVGVWTTAVMGVWPSGIARAEEGIRAVPAMATRGRAQAVIVDQAPSHDGSLRDSLWHRCPRLLLGACTSSEELTPATWAHVLFDATHVHIGIYCEEPDTQAMVVRASRRDEDVWQDDSVEVFIRADPDKPYRHFAINPKGILYDALALDPQWNSSAEAHATVEPGRSWTATLRIPMKDLDAYVGEQQTWRLNITRSRQPRDGQPLWESSWAILSSTRFHSPEEFGVVSNVAVPHREDGVTRVRPPSPPPPPGPEVGKTVGGVTVYRTHRFDSGLEGWTPAGPAEVELRQEDLDGPALRVRCKGQWGGAYLPVRIHGSRQLRIVYHAKSRGVAAAWINVADSVSRDNTTSYAYRFLQENEWVPVLYFLDRFRYNSKITGFVEPNTAYRGVQLFGPAAPDAETWFVIDNFAIYRGQDLTPPEAPTHLCADSTAEGVVLSWKAAQDNVMPMVYAVARSRPGEPFLKIGETCRTSFVDRTVSPGKWQYRVLAVDFEENLGPWSEVVEVQAKGVSPVASESSPEETDRLAYTDHVREVHARGTEKRRKGWVTLFGDSLTGATVYRECVQSAFRNMQVSAYGYPSETTAFGARHIARILQDENPEFLCVLFGTNNDKSEPAIHAAMADLESIVKACEERGTVALLGTIPPRGFTDPDSVPEARYNAAVVALARRLRVPVAYIFESIQAAGDRRRFLAPDGVHWTGEGMEVAGKAWGRTMAQVRFVLRYHE